MEIRVISEGANPSVYSAIIAPKVGSTSGGTGKTGGASSNETSFQDTLNAKMEETGSAEAGTAAAEDTVDTELSSKVYGASEHAASESDSLSFSANGVEYQIPKATVTTFANAFAHALLSAALEKKDALSAEEAAKAAEAAAAQVSDKTANATEPTKAAESAATEQTGTAENGAAGSEAAAAAPAPAAAETSATAVHAPRYDDIFTKASETYGVDKKLLMAVARVESAYTADAVSSAGAMGVMQLMPATAEAMGVPNAFDPEQNIMGGAKLLSILLNKYSGNTTLALAAYNAGGGAVDRAGGVPSEGVQRYVDKVLGYYSGS